jgi:hypothetical protein
VLDRLERSDRPAELVADLGVLDAEIEAALRGAHLLGGERDLAARECALDRGPAGGAETRGLGHADVGQGDVGEGARRVHRRQPMTAYTRGAGGDFVEREAVGAGGAGRARDDEQEVRAVSVEDEALATFEEHVTAGRGACRRGDRRGIRIASDLEPRDRRSDIATREHRQDRMLLLVGAALAERRGREHRRREKWDRRQRAAELLHHAHHLDPSEPRAAVALGDGEAGDPELACE